MQSLFQGSASEWEPLEQTIRYVFDRCSTKMRYLEQDITLSRGIRGEGRRGLPEENGVSAGDVDLLVYGGIARDAFEPATAAEVAGRIGATSVHAMDVTCACAGLIEALHVVAGYFALHDDIDTAIICSGELTRDRINYDIQTFEQMMIDVAGLTLGNAAAALLITRERLPKGGARPGPRTRPSASTGPRAGPRSTATSESQSKELFALAVHTPPEVSRLLDDAGWKPEEVDHYASISPARQCWNESSANWARDPRPACTPTRCSATPQAPRGLWRWTIGSSTATSKTVTRS